MAGDFGGEGVGAQGLADGARGVAANAVSEGRVGGHFAEGNFAQGGVDFGGEGGDGVFSFQCSVIGELTRRGLRKLGLKTEH